MKNTMRQIMASALVLCSCIGGVAPAMAATTNTAPANVVTQAARSGGLVDEPEEIYTSQKLVSRSFTADYGGNWATAAFYNTGSTSVYLSIERCNYADNEIKVVEPGKIQFVKVRDTQGNAFYDDELVVTLEREGSSGKIDGTLYMYNGSDSLGIFDYLPHV